MTAPENINVIMLIVAIVLVLIIFTLSLVQTIRGKRIPIGPITIILLIIGVSLLIPITFNASEIKTAEWVQIILMIGLVSVTAVYAFSATRQANASVKMAEEMKEQRRPIVVQEAIEPKGAAISFGDAEDIEITPSDYFQIRNVGNGPAIELEILTLNEKKSLLEMQKKMVFSQADPPLKFHPTNLVEHVNSTCYLLCQYRSVLSYEIKQTWYQSWLPFKPVRSKRGDKIIIQPKELVFRELDRKETF